MAHKVYTGEGEQPTMRIVVHDYPIEFCVSMVPIEHREWLGEVLDHQIETIVNRVVAAKIREHQQAFQKLLGL